MKNFFGKHKKLIIFIIIVLLVLGAVFFVRKKTKEAQEKLAEMMNTQETALVEKRSLVDSLPATGSIVAIDSKDVSANITNVKVLEFSLEVGDYVNEGDVICVLDAENLEDSVKALQATLNVSEGQSDISISSSERALNEAEVNKAIDSDRAMQDRDLAWEDYQRALTDVETAKEKYDDAQHELEIKNGELEAAIERGDENNGAKPVAYWEGQVSSAEAVRDSAKSAYEQSIRTSDSYYRTYNQRERAYEDSLRNGDSNILNRNDSVYTSQLSDTAVGVNERQQIKNYEKQINECVVYAPISGVVTATGVEEGKIYTGATIATIEDDSIYEITAEIDEYDITKVRLGQQVIFKTNGTGDEEFEGVVKEIAPKATRTMSAAGISSVGNNVTYKVKIAINSPMDEFKMDMTAKLSIIIESRDNVLTVPYDALQVDEDGEYFIEAVNDSAVEITYDTDSENKDNTSDDRSGQQAEKPETRRIFVEKGLESDYYVEVRGKDVKEGMTVVVPSNGNAMNDFMQLLEEQGAMGGF